MGATTRRRLNAWLTTRGQICGAASPDGWTCEGFPNHEHAEHFADGAVLSDGSVVGDVVWTGTTPLMERRAEIHGFIVEFSPISTADLAESLSLHPTTIRRHCRALEREGLIAYTGLWREWEAE